MDKPERRLVKKSVIPITLVDDPNEIAGLLHFPTETTTRTLLPHVATATRKKHTITFRREDQEEEEEPENTRKKDIEFYEVDFVPLRQKEKEFRADIPITRGYKSSRSFGRSSELFFHFSFNNKEGRLCFLNGVQEAKMEISGVGSGLSIRERAELQQSMMDNRRRQPLADILPLPDREE